MIQLYQIECETANHIYIGLSSDVLFRWRQHRNRRGAAFTKKHGAKRLILLQEFNDTDVAKKAERELVIKLSEAGYIVAGASWTFGQGRQKIQHRSSE